MWKKAKQELINGFENLQTGINITTDVWSAPHNCPESYICVTAHWVNPATWQMLKRTIAFELFDYPHTGQNLFNILSYVFQTFKIENKIFSISFDNASNNTNAVGLLKIRYAPIMDGAFYHSRCMAHIINLAVQDGLNIPSVQIFHEAFKLMLKDIFKSNKRRHALYRKLCQDTNSRYLGPNWDVPNRWNSTHHMFACAVRQKETLKLFHDHLASKGKVVQFPESYWEAISELAEFLQVFKTATTLLSGTYYPTSPIVLQQVAFMSETIDNFSLKSDMFMEVTTAIKLKFQKYLLDVPSVFTCSAALNPCYNTLGVDTLIDQINDNLCIYKENPHWGPLMKTKFENDFKSLYEHYNEKYGNSAQPGLFQTSQFSTRGSSSSSHDPNINLYNRMRQESVKRQRGNTPTSEYGRYTGTDFLSSMTPEEFATFDILAWWKGKEQQFPILSTMAKDLLTVQASTVASESAFSLSGRVISLRRTKLTPTSVEMCICLKDHLDAAERIQHISSLEEPAPFELETRLHEEEVASGVADPLSDEELQSELATRIGEDEEYPF